ncbi:MAG TPA: hypothetical protein VHY91_27315 [Pirellulales bacterium]|jgi:hypothetical protein|nr:hypothetical protein [Pirellulales bacterium]
MPIAQALLWIATACVTADAPPEEPAADETALAAATAAKIDFYLNSMLAERQKLRSGEFVVSGTKSAKLPKKPEWDYSGRVVLYCAFDATRIRFDNREPGIVAELPLTKPRKLTPGRIERMFFRTPERSVTWFQTNGRNEIGISEPGSMSGQFLFFDVRGLGSMAWQDLTSQRSGGIQKAIPALTRFARNVTVETSDPKYVQLVFLKDLGTRFEESRYWLRPDQGFAPVRLDTRVLFSRDEGWLPHEHTETSWEQRDSIWLPVKFEMTLSDASGELNLAWKIRWQSVNKPIDDARFDWKDFGAPETVPVFDTRTGEVFVIRPGPQDKSLTVTEWMAQPWPKP